jgi:hypothetical protein
LNTTLTESQVIAAAVNAFVRESFDRALKDILVQETKRLATLSGAGWKVYFVFDEEDQFLKKSVTFEVNEEGAVSLFESM